MATVHTVYYWRTIYFNDDLSNIFLEPLPLSIAVWFISVPLFGVLVITRLVLIIVVALSWTQLLL